MSKRMICDVVNCCKPILEEESHQVTIGGMPMDICPECFASNICLNSMTKARVRKPRASKPKVGRPKGSTSRMLAEITQ